MRIGLITLTVQADPDFVADALRIVSDRLRTNPSKLDEAPERLTYHWQVAPDSAVELETPSVPSASFLVSFTYAHAHRAAR